MKKRMLMAGVRTGRSPTLMNPRSVLNIGAEFDAKQPSDGYTIVQVSSAITISPSLYQQLNYDPVRDFAPISLVAQLPNVIKDANIKVE